MLINSLLRKGMAFAIIVLFLGISILLPAGSLSVEKYSPALGLRKDFNNMKDAGPGDVNWTVNGTQGMNGWYVSNLTLTCTYNNSTVAKVYYRYTGTKWKLYTEPFTISRQGVIEFEWYCIDYNGTVSPPQGPFLYGIDYTPPIIELIKEKIGFMKRVIIVHVYVYDEISGVDKVEFYLNGVLQFTAIGPGPFEWALSPIPHIKANITVVAYDFAGNHATSPPVNPNSNSQSQSGYQRILICQRLNQCLHGLLMDHQIAIK